MRYLLVALLLAVLVCPTVRAAVTSEDVTYWLAGGAVWWNPSAESLEQNADKLILKVQQTVYDNEWTRQITGLTDTTGYLYSYTITNLGYLGPEGQGVKLFEVEWPVNPLYVGVSPQTISGWTGSSVEGNPVLKWDSTGPGLERASSVTLWAISPIAEDSYVTARAAGVPDPGTSYPFLYGQTSGPIIPEPSALAGLFMAFGASAYLVRLRRR
ncbi:MAG: PEP-CTERM sorting domain-containing protein [Armatimonadetes bacterium]|nr:PEP-CTERM sorting domain-containing protein [Armatimonadota bacterium]